MPESWRNIPGFDGAYQVSNQGNLRSVDRVTITRNGRSHTLKGRPLTPRVDADGYLRVDLRNAGHRKTCKVHRLVALAWLTGTGDEVDHKNGRRDDNRACNLRWSTKSQNRANSHTRKNQSGATGVRRVPSTRNPWQAYGRVDGKFKSLGCYPNKQKAIAARRRHLKEVFSV